MVKESWRRMQVPIIGIVGILMIFVLVAVKLGATTDEQVSKSAMATYIKFDPPIIGSGECDKLYDPVCAMDGATYDNFCLAKAAGATVAYQGACR